MSLNNVGTHTFLVVGKPKWTRSRWDLDRVTVPYRGSAENFDAFIAALTIGSNYSGDSNMKLDDWDNDDHQQFPTVNLIYTGKKGGTLPPDKNGTSYTIQQAQFTSFFYTDDEGLRITLTYIAPTSTKVKWGTSALDIATIGAATAANCTVVWFTAEAHGSWVSVIPTNEATALAYFVQKEAILGDSDEIVSTAYFRGTQTKQNLLFSSEF